MLHDHAEEPLLRQVLDTEAFATLRSRLASYEHEISALEREVSKLKAREKELKGNFAYELTFGQSKR